MPYHVATKTLFALQARGGRSASTKVLVVGVTFKKNIEDSRESPALKIMELLMQQGVKVSYHDPHVPTFSVAGRAFTSRPLTAATIRGADCVLIVTDHSAIDYAALVRHAKLVVDTRNATRDVAEGREKIVKL